MQSVKAVRIRMYRQGLGDCFLLSFSNNQDFSDASHVLIDCGTIGATTTGVKMADVVKDISETTKHKLSLLIATHEHLDHLSGFKSQQKAFDKIEVGHVWVAWTEDPDDALAKELEKYSGDLKLAALAALSALKKSSETDSAAQGMAESMRAVLSFFSGADTLGAAFAEGVDEAMKYVCSRASEQTAEYLKPGTYLQPAWLPGVTVYVLGPPRDKTKIKNMGEHGNPELYELYSRSVEGFGACAEWFGYEGDWKSYSESLSPIALDNLDLSLPFDQRFRIFAEDSDIRFSSYFDGSNAWRRIDADWLFASADLALQLDNLTNNTSLVLAFEIGEDGPVILMAADAQLGSWLSWHDYTWEVPRSNDSTRKIQAKDLLSRTLVYKVGHHSSHNATAVEHGLEMMTNKALVALIPLDEQVAHSKRWPMPAQKLFDRLLEKTQGRILRSDNGWPDDSARPTTVSNTQWKKLSSGLEIKEEDNYIDVLFTV